MKIFLLHYTVIKYMKSSYYLIVARDSLSIYFYITSRQHTHIPVFTVSLYVCGQLAWWVKCPEVRWREQECRWQGNDTGPSAYNRKRFVSHVFELKDKLSPVQFPHLYRESLWITGSTGGRES